MGALAADTVVGGVAGDGWGEGWSPTGENNILTENKDSGLRAELLEEVIKLVRVKVNHEQRETIAAIVQKYLGQVDP